ncbi:MAG: hypothetical protein JST96_07960 [Bacteroidetes bacterium]|nr:hypothetical protein [Bacteroidota bacterium]
MKKNAIVCLLLLITYSSFAQLGKKGFLVGGFGDFSYANQSSSSTGYSQTNKLTALGISAGGGYFIMDRLCAGLRFTGNLNNLNQHANNTSDAISINGGIVDTLHSVIDSKYISKTHSYGFSPFLRYYFLTATHKINILAELNYTHSFDASGYSSANYVYTYSGSNPQYSENLNVDLKKTQSNAVGIQAGPAFFFNPKVSLDVMIGWQYSKSDNLTTNSFTVGVGFQVYLKKI